MSLHDLPRPGPGAAIIRLPLPETGQHRDRVAAALTSTWRTASEIGASADLDAVRTANALTLLVRDGLAERLRAENRPVRYRGISPAPRRLRSLAPPVQANEAASDVAAFQRARIVRVLAALGPDCNAADWKHVHWLALAADTLERIA